MTVNEDHAQPEQQTWQWGDLPLFGPPEGGRSWTGWWTRDCVASAVGAAGGAAAPLAGAIAAGGGCGGLGVGVVSGAAGTGAIAAAPALVVAVPAIAAGALTVKAARSKTARRLGREFMDGFRESRAGPQAEKGETAAAGPVPTAVSVCLTEDNSGPGPDGHHAGG